MMGGTGEKEWKIRGGLRFWLAPEDLTRTYFPDNRPVTHTPLGDFAARFTPPPEEPYGVQKVMELRLEEAGTRVHVRLEGHERRPDGDDARPLGADGDGPRRRGDHPDPAAREPPGHPKNAKHPGDFAPNQSLVLWPFFDFTDDRWTFGSRYIFLRQDAKKGPTKLGLGHPVPWVAYWNQGNLFVKRFRHIEWAKYPDLGTSYQTFSNEDMLEMETVGMLTTLSPGQSAELEETWQLFTDVPPVKTEAEVDRVIRPLLRE